MVSFLLRWWVSTGELTISRRRIDTDIEILSLHKIYMHHILHSRDTSGDLTSSFRTNFLDLRVDRRQDSGRRGVNRLSQPVVYYVRAFLNICRWFHILNREPFLNMFNIRGELNSD